VYVKLVSKECISLLSTIILFTEKTIDPKMVYASFPASAAVWMGSTCCLETSVTRY